MIRPDTMSTALQSDFRKSVAMVVKRFLAQNRLASVGDHVVRLLADVLWEPVVDGCSEKSELPETAVQVGVARLLAVFTPPRPELENLAKQLLKGCHQAAPSRCCESYRNADTAGRCRRQELAYDLVRVSGAHCVDCPHWLSGSPEEHEERLTAAWQEGAVAFTENREVFLPEDFRMLRRLARARNES